MSLTPPSTEIPDTLVVPSPPSSPAVPNPDNEIAEQIERKRQSRKRARDARRKKRQANTSVYITGLPLDASESELAKHFSKCGILLPCAETGKPRVKLYLNEQGEFKGDGLVTYAMEASVENAVMILDGAPLRIGGAGLGVEKASFEHKAEGVQVKKKKVEGDGKKVKTGFRSRDLVAEALSWADEGQKEGRVGGIVVLKNVFLGGEVDYGEVREDMEEGCEACGEVEKVTVFERNTEGAVAVKFRTLEGCVKCIEVMNGRWYDGRRLTAEFYDGVTDYRYKETEEDQRERDRKWSEWLQGGGEERQSKTTEHNLHNGVPNSED